MLSNMLHVIECYQYNIRKITTGQGDDYTNGCLLDYNYFNND